MFEANSFATTGLHPPLGQQLGDQASRPSTIDARAKEFFSAT
jgi:hypothetical protein